LERLKWVIETGEWNKKEAGLGVEEERVGKALKTKVKKWLMKKNN